MKLQLKSTLSTIKDHLFIINNEFTIQKMSHTLAEILNLPSHEIIGKKCYEILHGTDSPPPYCPHIIDTLKETKKLTFYEPHLQKTIQLKISPLIDDQGSCHGSVNILNISKH
jgi:hypothetical protein